MSSGMSQKCGVSEIRAVRIPINMIIILPMTIQIMVLFDICMVMSAVCGSFFLFVMIHLTGRKIAAQDHHINGHCRLADCIEGVKEHWRGAWADFRSSKSTNMPRIGVMAQKIPARAPATGGCMDRFKMFRIVCQTESRL
jgi:hypothetical protein